MENKKFPVEKIPSLIFLQKKIREKIYLKEALNLELNNYYNIIYGMMKRIYSNFLLGITNQYDYNAYMSNLDEILYDFKKIKRPLGFGDLSRESKKIFI